MSERLDWYASFLAFHFYEKGAKIGLKRNLDAPYLGRPLLNTRQASDFIRSHIEQNQPLMACRYGGDELNVTSATAAYQNGISRTLITKHHNLRYIYDSAGVFPEGEETLLKFGQVMLECSSEIDLLGVWYNIMEDYVVKKYAPKTVQFTHLRNLEPWYDPEHPWTASLKGKRVLIISPFVSTMKAQYEKRDSLFPGTDILPECDIQFFKAVVSGGGQKDERFNDWFEALDYMYDKAMEIGFDVVILGCASYGFPLAARFKKAGKAAIQLGGATQLLFGIKGSRWDNHPIISKLYNDAWVRLSKDEYFSDINLVEKGCYW